MLTHYQKKTLLFVLLLFSRYGFNAICGAVVGGAVALRMVHAQSLRDLTDRERLAADDIKVINLEFKVSQLQASNESLMKQQNIQENEISKMEGIGEGLGLILIVLQVLQAFVAKNLGSNTGPPKS